jgi:hypothetical protein
MTQRILADLAIAGFDDIQQPHFAATQALWETRRHAPH